MNCNSCHHLCIKSPSHGWNAFELRMYDAVIGRWMGVDPRRQYHSPYSGMGNDPIKKLDPTGGYSIFGAFWRNGFSREGLHKDKSSGEWGIFKGSNPSTSEDNGDGITTIVGHPIYDYGKSYASSNKETSMENWNIGHSLLAWVSQQGMKGGFVLSSKDSYAGSNDNNRGRGKNVGAVSSINIDNITTVFNTIKLVSKSTFESAVNFVENWHNGTEIVEKSGLIDKGKSVLEPKPKLDTLYYMGDTLYRNHGTGRIHWNPDSLR